MGVSQLGSDAEYDLQVDMGLEVGRHPGGQDSERAWSGGEEVGGGRGSWVPWGGLSLKPQHRRVSLPRPWGGGEPRCPLVAWARPPHPGLPAPPKTTSWAR